jgi:DNA-binding winged helix-turn-helix (wHTH) protein
MYTTFHYTRETDNFTFTCFHVDEKGTDAIHTHMSVIFTPAQLEVLEGMIQRAKDKRGSKE